MIEPAQLLAHTRKQIVCYCISALCLHLSGFNTLLLFFLSSVTFPRVRDTATQTV